MKRLKHYIAILSIVAAVSFITSTVSAHIPQKNAGKGHTRISKVKKPGKIVKDSKKAHNLKKGKIKKTRHIAIKGKGHATRMYTARKGDTIIKVAARFKKRARDLRAINGLKGNSLKPGQKILLTRMPSGKKGKNSKVVGYSWETSPAANSARLAEVKKLTVSKDLLAELSMEERMVLFAKKMLHFPYHFGGNGAMGLDCSSYVQKVFGFVGRTLPRSAREQFNVGEAIDREDLEKGDLVFFSTYASFPSHVGIYLGNNLFIHASSASRKVIINSLETPYYFRRYIGAKRIISTDNRVVTLASANAK